MQSIEIQTAQNVNIEYPVASVGDRIVAAIIDQLIMIGYLIAVIFFYIWLLNVTEGSPFYYPVAYFVILFLPLFFYHLLCETFLNGQSFGKKIMKMRVVKLDGSQAGVGSYFLRWILAPIDLYFTYGSVGLVTMLINGKGQRLGDLAGNTTVIKLKQEVRLEEILIQNVIQNYEVKFPQVSLLTDIDIQVINDVLNHRKNTDINSYQIILEKAKISVSNKIGLQSEMNALSFLDTVIKDYTYLNSN